jgi:hypothetical protein
VQETHFVFAKIDESGIDSRQNILYRGGIDVAQQEFSAVDEKFDDPIIFEYRSDTVMLGDN